MQNRVTINTDRKGPIIERDVYGHFSEHLGRCIYGGLWVGEDSPIPNIRGYRRDVVEALKKLDIPNLRWPGGCFADEYHWKDGIGPRAERKRMVNTHWGGVVEDNSFGTHEFLELCELLECKPYICGNVGSGTVQEMSEWVEYMTFDGESPMAELRRRNGREKAWKLPYFGVGNENWGCGGNMRPEYYADLYRRYQTYVRNYTKDRIFKIAGGANVDDYRWTEVLMREAHWLMDGLSLHYYAYEERWEDKRSATDFDETGWFKVLKNALRMDELITKHSTIMDRYDPSRRVAMVVDEWGCWHQAEPGTNPGFLYQQNTLRDALVAGLTLNVFHKHADRVRVANLAQTVNVLQAPILTEGDRIVLTPTFHVLEMYKGHQGASLLDSSVECGRYEHLGQSIEAVNASASIKADGTITVSLCNTDPADPQEVSVELRGPVPAAAKAAARVLTAPAMNTMNTFDAPDTLVPTELAVRREGNTLKITLPAKAVAVITLTA